MWYIENNSDNTDIPCCILDLLIQTCTILRIGKDTSMCCTRDSAEFMLIAVQNSAESAWAGKTEQSQVVRGSGQLSLC